MFSLAKQYDVLVVGGGHAGIEAALAASRLGCKTALLTQNLDTIGQMSCNPAIGGLAKGHIVREIDALGGFMGGNTDATGIQFRMLNGTKGSSVRAPRAQCDKKAYQFRAKAILEGTRKPGRQAGFGAKGLDSRWSRDSSGDGHRGADPRRNRHHYFWHFLAGTASHRGDIKTWRTNG